MNNCISRSFFINIRVNSPLQRGCYVKAIPLKISLANAPFLFPWFFNSKIRCGSPGVSAFTGINEVVQKRVCVCTYKSVCIYLYTCMYLPPTSLLTGFPSCWVRVFMQMFDKIWLHPQDYGGLQVARNEKMNKNKKWIKIKMNKK